MIGDTRTDTFETTSTMLTYSNVSGIYKVQCSFVDVFGEGYIIEKQVSIKATIDKDLLDLESLGIANMNKEINQLSNTVGTVKTSVNGFENKIVSIEKGFT